MKDQWVEWFQERQRHFFYGVVLVIAVLFLAFQILGTTQRSLSKEHIQAERALHLWKQEGGDIEALTALLQQHPSLQTDFGAFVAEKFIAQNEGNKAEPFARGVFQRVLSTMPDHTAFAEGSLLIAKGNFTEALDAATKLHEHLSKESLLYGFNLVRLASLYRKLGEKTEEIASLKELEAFLNKGSPEAKTLLECFTEDTTTLLDYIADRQACV